MATDPVSSPRTEPAKIAFCLIICICTLVTLINIQWRPDVQHPDWQYVCPNSGLCSQGLFGFKEGAGGN